MIKSIISKKNISHLLSLSTIVCAIINLFYFASYGWDKYAISTNRGGIGYNYYIYMNISKGEIIKNLNTILLFSSYTILLQIVAIVSDKKWVKLVSIFLFILLLFELHEYHIYLSSKWVGKG